MTDEIQRAAAERQTNHAVPGARVARVRDASETFRGQRPVTCCPLHEARRNFPAPILKPDSRSRRSARSHSPKSRSLPTSCPLNLPLLLRTCSFVTGAGRIRTWVAHSLGVPGQRRAPNPLAREQARLILTTSARVLRLSRWHS